MFSKEESKKIRQEFWTSFGKSFPRKWILYNTGIKDFAFKFYFDTKKAMVCLDIEHPDFEKRVFYYDKMLSLKVVLMESLPDIIYEDFQVLENGKEISRLYINLNDVCIHDKNTWQQTMEFLNTKMICFETFFNEYSDYIRSK